MLGKKLRTLTQKKLLPKNKITPRILKDNQKLIAKLNAYGFDKSSLKLFHSYLSNIWHRTKVNNKFSHWAELLQRNSGIRFRSSFFSIYT